MTAHRVLVLVDGSNVAQSAAWRRHVAPGDAALGLRATLVDALASWAARSGSSVCMTFDGEGPHGVGVRHVTPDLEVVGSGSRTGDAVLEARAAEARGAARVHWLVTSDRALQAVAGMGADRVIAADVFVAELLHAARDAPSGESTVDVSATAGSQVGAVVDEDTRARLERLRRGQ